MLKTAAVSGSIAILIMGLASVGLIGPIGPCANLQQIIVLLAFLLSSLVAVLSLGGASLRYLARRFPRE
jgi:hypothetical protein